MLRTLTARELMRLHVGALFTHNAAGRMLRVNTPDGADAARFFLGRTIDGSVIHFRHDVDNETQIALEAAANDDPVRALDSPADSSRYEAILSRTAPIADTWVGPAFCFPNDLSEPGDTIRVTDANAHVLRPLLEPWIPDVRIGQPLFATVVDGQAVSVCCSVRETSAAHEVGVETVPSFRGRGYAARVVASWARALRDMGLVPLYSTSWTNEASRAVARKLGLIQFGSDLHIT